MGPNDRLAASGAVAVFVSLLLPWYGAPVADLVQTGMGSFNFSTAALLLTVGAALFLALELGRGYSLPRPLSAGVLEIVAGVWATLIVLYLMADRPVFDFAGLNDDYELRYGIFVALFGSVTIAMAGVQRRRHERAGRAAHDDDDLDDLEELDEEEDDD